MSVRERLALHYPMFGLEVRTPRLTLRYPDDEDALALAELAARGIHTEDRMPFAMPWSRVPEPYLQRNTLAFLWGRRVAAQQSAWSLPLVAVVDGVVVGTQDIGSASWAVTRTFGTGSWLGLAHQGQGIGREMRAAVLQLGFEGFGAVRAVTSAYEDNPSSLSVTRSLGYRPNGADRVAREGEPVMEHRFVLDRADWEPKRRADIEIVGASAVLEVFGTEHLPGG